MAKRKRVTTPITWTDGDAMPAGKKVSVKKFWTDVVAEAKAHPGQVGVVGVFSPGVAFWIRNGNYEYFLPNHPVANKQAFMKRHWDVSVSDTRWVPNGNGGVKKVCDLLIMFVGASCICDECA